MADRGSYFEANTLVRKLPNLTQRLKKLEWTTWLLVVFALSIITVILLVVFDIISVSSPFKAFTGRVINIAGCGTDVGALPGCRSAINPKYCNETTGSCSTAGSTYAFVWRCDGSVPDCRDNQLAWNAQGTFAVSSYGECGTSVQIDIFNKQCRPAGDPYGGWQCGATDLVDYMTYYIDPQECTDPTPTPFVTPYNTPEVKLCVIENTAAEFRPDGQDPWRSGSEMTTYLTGANRMQAVDIRCVEDKTTTPPTMMTQGVIDVFYSTGTSADVQLRRFDMPANGTITGLNWGDIYDLYGNGIYKFVCSAT